MRRRSDAIYAVAYRYRRGVIFVRRTWPRLAVAGLVPIAASAAWIPLRDRLPNTDLALVLVLTIAGGGWMLGQGASLISAVCAASSFDVLDTRPYGAVTMSRGTDVVTALLLLATGFLIGAGAAHLARYRRSEGHRTDAFAVVMEASGLVATGREGKLVAEAMVEELRHGLDLEDCTFHPHPPSGTHPAIARDGSVVGLLAGGAVGSCPQVDLPVWSQGDIVAHYRLTLGSRKPSRDDLRVALSLADQAGAAIADGRRHPAPGSRAPRQLRPT